jgi:quinol monooxygenase YgiN
MSDEHLIVMTEVTTKPERQAKVWEAMATIAQVAREQAGCIEYCILQSAEDPAVTINYERWTSEEARDVFMASAAVATFVEAIDIPNSFIGNPGPVTYKIKA